MAFATDTERLKDTTFGLDFVVRFQKNGRESELDADDLEHAMDLSAHWVNNDAEYVEIFRVLYDGSLNPTIGAFRKESSCSAS